VVVSHDATTGRCGDKNLKINDVTYDELRRVDVATSYRKAAGLTVEQYPPVAPPLLKEVLALIKRHPDVHQSIQPKDESVDAAVALVKGMDMVGQIGFNDGSLEKMKRVKELEPRLIVHWDLPTKVDVPAAIATAKKYGFEAIVLKAPGVTPEKVRQIKTAGLEMGVWTVDDPAEITKFLDWGVDRIYTDRPDVALKIKAGREGK
jgi:glycerophosphoryl diester phosphodiesterase